MVLSETSKLDSKCAWVPKVMALIMVASEIPKQGYNILVAFSALHSLSAQWLHSNESDTRPTECISSLSGFILFIYLFIVLFCFYSWSFGRMIMITVSFFFFLFNLLICAVFVSSPNHFWPCLLLPIIIIRLSYHQFVLLAFISQLYCSIGISPMGNSGCFLLGEPAATESRYPTSSACWVF